MIKPLYVGYYTEDTGYVDEAKELEKTLVEHSLHYVLRPIPNLGSWQKNTHHKAQFIRTMRQEFPDRSLVYLDVDARIRQYPALFDTLSCDFAAHHFINKKRGTTELLSGTLYFAPTPKVDELIEHWMMANETLPDRWEQKNLEIALRHTRNIDFFELPASYVLIFDLMADQGPPIIEHLQASRRLKNTLGLEET